jgi:leucyl aminopeptidase
VQFSIRTQAPEKVPSACLVLAVYEGKILSRTAQAADKAAGGALKHALAQGDLAAKAGATLLLHKPKGLAAARVLLVSLGARADYGVGPFREAVRGAASALKGLGAKDAALFIADFAVAARGLPWAVRNAVLVTREVFYRFDQLKTQKKPADPVLASLTLAIAGAPVTLQAQAALKEALATADGADLARTLGNLPPNLCTPSYLAEEAKKLAKQFKLGIEVLERRDMEKLGMGALLAVTAGSRQPPKLIVLRYNGAAKGKKPRAPHFAFVGKGITFDTGGISLKPSAEMDEMKYDMSGAGSVLGAIRALAGMRAPVNVVGVIPTCENMPGGNATRPGDVVTTMSGQTVEILNTDAEGRLILCDALTYAERFSPDAVVDIATLTGACVVALGRVASGLFANDQKLADEIIAAGDDAWDRVWQMPIWEDYQEQLRSNFADMANIGGREGGSITAACYLARFTRKLKWAHLDVAGTAWRSGREKGSTARPVPLLVRLALRRAGRK